MTYEIGKGYFFTFHKPWMNEQIQLHAIVKAIYVPSYPSASSSLRIQELSSSMAFSSTAASKTPPREWTVPLDMIANGIEII